MKPNITPMKKRILQLTLFIAATVMLRCSDDDKPQVIPVVATLAASDITPGSVVLNGKITDDGNATITETGFVYSNAVSTPTVADDKVELNDIDGEFSTLLEGLNSGTIYYIRAYATNGIGTGYGDVINVTTENAAPTTGNVSITGSLEVNKIVTAVYSYLDPEGDAESGTTFQWYIANDGTGVGETSIPGAISSMYTIEEAQQGKYLRVGITPKAATGNTTGTEVRSAFVGAIGEATTLTFTYNNKQVTYGIISSPTTGRKWLDRNLGAPNVASAVDDYVNFGDLFQWGRGADGHQLINREGPNDADMIGVNGTTSSDVPYDYSDTDKPGHSKLIIIPNGELPVDWRNPQNDALWQGLNGANNPCPSGWRIATDSEWSDEKIANANDGFLKLKITYSGNRKLDGTFQLSNSYGVYWTSTIPSENPTKATAAAISSGSLNKFALPRVSALACRCIEN